MSEHSEEVETSGYGEFEYMNGDTYTGKWELAGEVKKRQGHGKYTHYIRNGDSFLKEEYEGEWLDDKMHGYGVYKYLSGAVYEGQFVEGKHHGRGVYYFANGAKYEGNWESHRMHGSGVYTDQYGVVWKGIFNQGTFESSIQKRLKKEHEIQQKVNKIAGVAKEKLTEIKSVFQGEKKTWKENFTKYLVNLPEDVERFVGEPYAKWEDRTGDKWNELLGQVLEVEPHVLKSREDSYCLSEERIFGEQLDGEGQVVEFVKKTDNRKIELCMVVNDSESWFIFNCSDSVQK
mmetsp:Transcript_9362/g.13939  ORF Transcript_9362/g.13939 Transcript_9362/m.13939 type:complete len:289 (-) Transcript_9362:35-901(-)